MNTSSSATASTQTTNSKVAASFTRGYSGPWTRYKRRRRRAWGRVLGTARSGTHQWPGQSRAGRRRTRSRCYQAGNQAAFLTEGATAIVGKGASCAGIAVVSSVKLKIKQVYIAATINESPESLRYWRRPSRSSSRNTRWRSPAPRQCPIDARYPRWVWVVCSLCCAPELFGMIQGVAVPMPGYETLSQSSAF